MELGEMCLCVAVSLGVCVCVISLPRATYEHSSGGHMARQSLGVVGSFVRPD